MSGSSAVEDLALALAVAFSIIILGYALRFFKVLSPLHSQSSNASSPNARPYNPIYVHVPPHPPTARFTQILTAAHSTGIGRFCTWVALPAFVFNALINLDFSGLDLNFFYAFLIAKGAVAIIVIAASLLFDRNQPAPLAAACMRAVMCTFSNDYALGVPVIDAIYPNPKWRMQFQPYQTQSYLMLVAPVSLLIINPICFVLMEISAIRNGLRDPPRKRSPRKKKSRTRSSSVAGEAVELEDRTPSTVLSPADSASALSFAEASRPHAISQTSADVELDASGLPSPVPVDAYPLDPGSEPELESDVEDNLNDSGEQGRPTFSLGRTIIKVLLKPVISSVIIGLALNYSLLGYSSVPLYVDKVTSKLGIAFGGPALLNLGGNMQGKLRSIGGKGLLTTALLICAKLFLLPILAATLLQSFHSASITQSDGTEVSLSVFAYIMGTLPTATAVFMLASDFGILVQEATATVLLCTIASAPVMLVSTAIASISIQGPENYQDLLERVSEDVGLISTLGALYLLIIHVVAPKVNAGHRLHIPALTVSAIGLGISLQTCKLSTGDFRLRYVIIWLFASGLRAAVLTSTLTMSLGLTLKERYTRGQQRAVAVLGVLMACAMTALAWWRMEEHEFTYQDDLRGANCWIINRMSHSHNTALILDIGVQASVLAVLSVSLVIMIRARKARQELAQSDLSHDLLAYDRLASNYSVASQMVDYDDQEALMAAREKHEDYLSYRDLVFVAVEIVFYFIELMTLLWILAGGVEQKEFAQVRVLDVFLLSAQGVILFAVFATKHRYTLPMRNLFRRIGRAMGLQKESYGGFNFDRLDPTIRRRVDKFLGLRAEFERAYPLKSSISRKLGPYMYFTAADLISFLVHTKLAESRDEALAHAIELIRVGEFEVVTGRIVRDDPSLRCRFLDDGNEVSLLCDA
ncbi:uncharacterized protein MONBRDRAFT_30258 [Monosiga brevicollis MX1]|uniref:DEP domain-containing protein n=1 Tax=Monosiga brevicollis TaxID=81824 RepID=A9VDG1_MONBE|nr:uncharacterized protein MONBRDRAFT_30258 [Monosiga brevicollis MX1]EDQ84440.1 predicted protein [Monosiga brevicollis MX1]|eukprot:XP_001750735.1 hypothetical protein [Monosiga brevicollis MX1]